MRHAWLCLLSFGFAGPVIAVDVDVVGNWSRAVDERDLQDGAGTDLLAPVESSTAVATIAITNTGGANWSVTASRNRISWPAGVGVAVRRSSSAPSGVTGGESYLTLADAEQTFFSGSGDATVEIQLKVDGMTVATPPAPYGLEISYTVQAL